MQTTLARPLPGRLVHFVGAGGVGMAALAELLLAMAYEVSGSDLLESETVRRLRRLGARVGVGPHTAAEVEGADHVVVSNAVPEDNEAVRRARELGIDVVPRAELLGRLLDAGRGVAVAGTAGKTTTSAMVALALDAAGYEPSFLIGGDVLDVGSGARLGTSDLIVAEADEAFGSFWHLRPSLAVVTNIGNDHLEFYGTQDGVDEAFRRFLSGRVAGAFAVLCLDDPGVRRVLPEVAAPVVTYGLAEGDMSVTSAAGGWALAWRGRELGTVALRTPGRHQALNAAAAAAAALLLGADAAPVLDALSTFGGVDRRFSIRGRAAGVEVVDDYAHHPMKIDATLRAAREAYPDARLVVLFQPHLYTRTRDLARELGRSLALADVVVVTDVYGQREAPLPGVTGRLVADEVGGAEVRYVPRLSDAEREVLELAREGDVLLTLGAGDVTGAGPRLLDRLARGDER